MKKILLIVTGFVLFTSYGYAQNLAINTDGSVADANAILDVKSNNKGILIPRMSTTARLSIPNTRGLLVYDSTTNCFWYNTGTEWKTIASSTALSCTDAWNLNGNNDNTDNDIFLGTSGGPINFRIASIAAGHIDGTAGNTYIGWLTSSGLGSGTENSGFGYGALFHLSSGNFNTALGYQALTSNTSGENNTATGHRALFNNSTGRWNTANGYWSLFGNISGEANTATGLMALYSNTTGHNNTAVGYLALVSNTTGSNNTALGYSALSANMTGAFNTAIGFGAGAISGDFVNTTAIGWDAHVTASNKVRIGNSAVTVIEGQVPFTTPSDGRFKFNVQDDVKGLDFVMQLRPVTYQFDVKRFDENLGHSATDASSYDDAEQMRRSGFIAQEVEKAAMKSGYNFSGLIKPKSSGDHYSLTYDAFVVPLVKAVQEQQMEIQALKKELDEIKKLLIEKNKTREGKSTSHTK